MEAGGAGGPTSVCRQTGRNIGGVRQPSQPRAPAGGNKASKSVTEKLVGVEAAVGETPSHTGEFVGETHRGLEHVQAYPLEGPSLIVGSGGSN